MNTTIKVANLKCHGCAATIKKGLTKFNGDYLGRSRWVAFNQKNLKLEDTNKPPAQYNSSWIDSAHKYRIIMSLYYRYNAKNDLWDKEVLINLTISNFYVFEQ